MVDKEKNPYDSHDGLHNAEDASSQEGGASAANADRCEHARGIVVDLQRFNQPHRTFKEVIEGCQADYKLR